MGATVDVFVFGVGSADAIESLTSGAPGGPVGAGGQVISVASSGGQVLGTVLRAAPLVTASIVGGDIGSLLTGIQITLDRNEGVDIKAGDLLSVGVGIPVALAVGVGLIGTSSILIPIATVATIVGAVANMNGVTLSDFFAKIYEWQKGSPITAEDRASVDQFLQRVLPMSYVTDPMLDSAQGVDPTTNTDFYNATRSRPVPRDPLAIDLDGDGIETVGIVQGNPVLFDHDADGTRTGTGWLLGDDAWLVLDRDGNGSIDTGRELFGVDTLISGTAGTASAVYARNGFEALRTLDANGDGVFNASDAAFTQVRLWRDLNQDGISQAGELSTLSSQNITGIGLTPSTTVTNLGNGNRINGTATVTRGNGTTTTAAGVGVNTTAANLDLANNPFYREFTTPVTLTTLAQDLPQMQGSGWVRDVRSDSDFLNIYSKAQNMIAISMHCK